MLDRDCFRCGSELIIYCQDCEKIPDYCNCKINKFKNQKDEYSDKNISEGIKLLE